ncbi:eukaryotic membrane protein family-domain-containing protein [Microdochium bolleyi]|uniref:Eukaryotic membrane protein family-domain-containing protein n=1 Tax=Microdochium bolleyi TaxID=196109 RepID=A0A136IU40_9PEZI|nr:eukaryotic membrane protein family-domain-containing protein [Microdochium bolleyi]
MRPLTPTNTLALRLAKLATLSSPPHHQCQFHHRHRLRRRPLAQPRARQHPPRDITELSPPQPRPTPTSHADCLRLWHRASPSPARNPAATSAPGGEPTSATRPRASSIQSTGVDDDTGGREPNRPPSHSTSSKKNDASTDGSTRKLSASQIQALTASPESLPVATVPSTSNGAPRKPSGAEYPLSAGVVDHQLQSHVDAIYQTPTPLDATFSAPNSATLPDQQRAAAGEGLRRPVSSRTVSTPPVDRRPATGPPLTFPPNTRRNSFNPLPRPPPLNLVVQVSNHAIPSPAVSQVTPSGSRQEKQDRAEPVTEAVPPAQMVPGLPIPPMSLPTHLQLELAAQRPSPLYIYGAQAGDLPYESSAVKFERLMNAIYLFPRLESMLCFGVLACFDAWLYTFTILPMRFVIAVWILVKWWLYVIWKEVCWVTSFVWQGMGRVWRRGFERGRSRSHADGSQSHSAASSRASSRAPSRAPSRAASRTRRSESNQPTPATTETPRLAATRIFHPPKHPLPRQNMGRHRRTKSMPSNLNSYHKADLLQGLIIICSSIALMDLDASRIYHVIRAQSSMKLYVIYNILEVGDRLLSAVGQDFFECLFSSETLSRNSSGRSKLLLPFCMFAVTLVYNILHVLCLFYQVITLNVAVNSYSNSLLTLLISNQFVEIKGAVFKKIEKENLFQLTCADVVERFQLWIILLIIAMRNIIEVGGFSIIDVITDADSGPAKSGPQHTSSIIPASFTLLPNWLFSGDVVSPFIVVIGIEIAVDFIKHAYINKFNNIRPTVYSRMLDVLAKDYYTNAFAAPSLIRRIGLPLIPLSCLFIRASLQVYNMFLATHLPPPASPPTSTMDLSAETSSSPSSPAMTAALEHLDTLIRNALGRTVYGDGSGGPAQVRPFWSYTSDDMIALVTKVVFFFLAWVVLLIVKLLLGMVLLHFSRKRYAEVKLREHLVATGKAEREMHSQPGVKRIGGWGAIELGDDRRKRIYEDDKEGLERMRTRERKTEEKNTAPPPGTAVPSDIDGLEKVVRYEMGPSKRIW